MPGWHVTHRVLVGRGTLVGQEARPVGSGALRIRVRITRPGSTSRTRGHQAGGHTPSLWPILLMYLLLPASVQWLQLGSGGKTHCPYRFTAYRRQLRSGGLGPWPRGSVHRRHQDNSQCCPQRRRSRMLEGDVRASKGGKPFTPLCITQLLLQVAMSGRPCCSQ